MTTYNTVSEICQVFSALLHANERTDVTVLLCDFRLILKLYIKSEWKGGELFCLPELGAAYFGNFSIRRDECISQCLKVWLRKWFVSYI
jgi:hypothetical protein